MCSAPAECVTLSTSCFEELEDRIARLELGGWRRRRLRLALRSLERRGEAGGVVGQRVLVHGLLRELDRFVELALADVRARQVVPPVRQPHLVVISRAEQMIRDLLAGGVVANLVEHARICVELRRIERGRIELIGERVRLHGARVVHRCVRDAAVGQPLIRAHVPAARVVEDRHRFGQLAVLIEDA